MIFYYLDASAWIKRYYYEVGTTRVQSLFAQNSRMACASLGMVEVIATLARKGKAGEIKLDQLEQKALELDWNQFVQIQFTTDVLDTARKLALDLALRGADAVHLASGLSLQKQLSEDDQLILVTSDHQLKGSASLSNLTVIDPAEQEAQR